MNIQILFDLQKNLYNSAITGVNLIDEDFRLKKSIEQFQTIKNSAPVFQKINENLHSLETEKDKSILLLDTINLVDAVCKTQAVFQSEKPAEPLKTFGNTDEDIFIMPYSLYSPIHEALTKTGGGRYEAISNIWQDNKRFFDDYRLQNELINALGDKYSELAELVIKILSESKFTSIIELLKSDFNLKGKKSMARRVKVISNIAGKKENDFYIYLIENAVSAIREAAISALRCDENNIDLLIELTKTQKGKCKKEALRTLGIFNTQKSNEFWKEYLQTHTTSENAEYLKDNGSNVVSDIIARLLSNTLNKAINEPNKDKLNDIMILLNGLIKSSFRKVSDKMIAFFLELVENRKFIEGYTSSGVTNYDIFAHLNTTIISTMIYTQNDKYIKDIIRIYHSCPTLFIKSGLTAYLFSEPEKSYDVFSKYYNIPQDWQEVLSVFAGVRYNNQKNIYEYYQYSYTAYETISIPLFEILDSRWAEILSTTTKPFHILGNKENTHEIVYRFHTNIIRGLINKNDYQSSQPFKTYLNNLMKIYSLKSSADKNSGVIIELIETLISMGETDFKNIGINFVDSSILKRSLGTDINTIYKIYRTIPMDNEDKIKELNQIYSKFESYLESASSTSYFNQNLLSQFKANIIALENGDKSTIFSNNESY